MFGSAIVYTGVLAGLIGLIGAVRLSRHPGRSRIRWRGLVGLAAGALLVAIGLTWPASESRASNPSTRLDQIAPVWQFSELHSIRIAASPERVFDAIRKVRADEIFLFRTLTWIRRCGRRLPESILNAGEQKPLIDVATSSGFVVLADDPPRELVIGTVVMAPPGTRGTLTPTVFEMDQPPGFALATMNFLVRPDGAGGSLVSTETRVYANSDGARRRFARYWRIIYPGSAIIRRMWLCAIQRRAMQASQERTGPERFTAAREVAWADDPHGKPSV